MQCPNCNHLVAVGDRFCGECGSKLNPSSTADHESVSAGAGSCSVTAQPCQVDEDGFCKDCGKRVLLLGTRTSKGRALRAHLETSVDESLGLVCDIGQKHKSNEDAGMVARREDGMALLVVADGVSSSWNAQAASTSAVQTIHDALLALAADSDPEAGVRQAIMEADFRVTALPNKSPDTAMDGPETTIVVALQQPDSWIIGWVGDSRAYLLGLDQQTQLTRDDSWIEDVVEAGVMSREEANQNKLAHAVTQTLGMKGEKLDIHVQRFALPEGRWILLLCTDGLWNYFEEAAAITHLCTPYFGNGQAVDLCRDLVGKVNALGGRDNVTVAAFIHA